jgi:DNA polymerase-3 subunit delta'
MPHVFLKTKQAIKECTLNISKLDLKEVYTFLKENQRIGKIEAKELIESILYKVNSSKLQLSQNELDRFSKAIKLCNLNSRPINVLSSLLLNLMAKR